MSQNIYKSQYLRSYELTKQLRSYFGKIEKLSSQYAYVVALGPRCFNLANVYLPEKENLISSDGLLAQHKELTEYYKKNGYFPKILVISEMVHQGVSMTHFLEQLETVVSGDFQNDDDYQKAYSYLKNSVNIYVYAKSNWPKLMNEAWTNRMKSELNLRGYENRKIFIWNQTDDLTPNEIHDLSMQLTDMLRVLERCTTQDFQRANTSFSYSARNKSLTDYLCYQNGQVPGWTRIVWDYDNEQMIVYIRLNNPTKIHQISTIRILPERSEKYAPQMTSLTLTNNINEHSLAKICEELKQLLCTANENRFVAIRELLDDKSIIIQSNKMQLIYFLLSVIDYHDFRSSAKKMFTQIEIESDTDDITKIACNFGLGEIKKELSELCASTELLKGIKEILDTIFNSETEPIMCGNEQKIGTQIFDNCEQANDAVSEIFYVLSTKLYHKTLYYSENVYMFLPQNYLYYDGENSQHNGIISFSDFNKIANQDYTSSLSNVYYRIASFISCIENDVVKLTFQASRKDKCLFVCCAEGPMAQFFGPKKIAIAIPAFNMLEDISRKFDMTPIEAIKCFCMKRNNEELKKWLNSDELEQWNQYHLDLIKTLQSNVEKYLEMIYISNKVKDGNGWKLNIKEMRGWNFVNLTVCYVNNKLLLKYQWILHKMVAAALENGDYLLN